MTHYERLGVRPDAPVDEIRRAYRDVARQQHPDSVGSAAGSAAGSDMAAVNEAWRVLSDPGRRAVYDAALRGPTPSPTPSPTATADLREQLARMTSSSRSRRTPIWPFVLVFVLAAIFILTTGAISPSPKPPTPDKLIFAGSCVDVAADQAVTEVDCAGTHDGVVQTVVDFDQTCPSGTQAYRDRQGRGWACVAPA